MKLTQFKKRFNLIVICIPHHYIGGAERVHLNIIKSLNRKPIVLFDHSNSKHISKEFSENAYCFLMKTPERIKLANRFINVLSFFLQITIFGSNSGMFYTIISKAKHRVRAIDLTHAFSFPEIGIETASLPYIYLLDKRVVINRRTYKDYKELYFKKNINQTLLERFVIIPNGIEIGDFDSKKIDSRFSNFTIGFVGRNSPEKRPELFFEIVRKLNVNAKVIGDDFRSFKRNFPNVIYFESCNDGKKIREQFSDISLLIVTSSREGFPLVIMEAMELGIPVLSTNVGSISEHLSDNLKGFLGPEDREEFLRFAVKNIGLMITNKNLYLKMSLNARAYAEENFTLQNFNNKYRELFDDKL